MGNFITKILCYLSRLDWGRIRANGQENKKINDNASDIAILKVTQPGYTYLEKKEG